MTPMRLPIPEDYEAFELCAACRRPVRREEAYKDRHRYYYHGECAEMDRCGVCGEWHEAGKRCPCGGEA